MPRCKRAFTYPHQVTRTIPHCPRAPGFIGKLTEFVPILRSQLYSLLPKSPGNDSPHRSAHRILSLVLRSLSRQADRPIISATKHTAFEGPPVPRMRTAPEVVMTSYLIFASIRVIRVSYAVRSIRFLPATSLPPNPGVR